MSLPKEPRQKMINLMYLVLTALLALNVSSEILNAFKIVKRSLDTSTGIAYGKTSQLFASFQRKMADPATKELATLWNDKAQAAHKLADDAYKYIEQMQLELKQEAGFNPPKDTTFKVDDLEAATRLFISGNEQKKTAPKGKEMYTKLLDFKTKLLAIDTTIGNEFANSLPLDLPKSYGEGATDWASGYFHMTPTIAGLTILSKFQNDIRNSEAQVVEFCHKKIGEVIFTYDAFKVIANSSSSYMMPGEEFTISAGIGAYSSQAQPSVSVGGMGAAVQTPDGDYMVKGTAESTPGTYSKTVNITYKDQKTGELKTAVREIKYTVGAPAGLTVSTDKTRVLYVGLDNPVKVTGSGGAEKTQLSVGQGTGVSVKDDGGGNYTVTCTQPGRVTLVATDTKSNKTSNIEIPVKRVPLPLATVGGVASGSMPVSKFKAQGGVIADLKDFVFEGVKYNVVSYFIMLTGAGFPEPVTDEVTGAGFSSRIRSSMGSCQDGTTVIIGNIKVDGPGGSRVLDQGITLILE